MARRIEAVTRVTAYPVNSKFSWPLQPEFKYTDFLAYYGSQSLEGTDVIETWPIADCITPRRKHVNHAQLMKGVPNLTDLFHPNDVVDPRGTEGTNTNLYWTETAFAVGGSGIWKKEYRGEGSISPGRPNQKFFKYITYRNDSRHSDDAYADPGWATFTLVANTNMDWVRQWDLYGDPILGPKVRCQGFSAQLKRGNYAIKQEWIGGDLSEHYQIHGLEDYTSLDFGWEESYTYLSQNSKSYAAIRFRVACGQDSLWFEIKFAAVGDPELYVTTDETFVTKTPIQPLRSSGSIKKVFGQTEDWTDVRFNRSGGSLSLTPNYRLIGSKVSNNVVVTLIGGFLHFEIEGETQPFVWDLRILHSFGNIGYGSDGTGQYGPNNCLTTFRRGDPIGLIEQIKVVFNECNWASWWIHPTKWDTQSQLLSKPINVGFVPITPLQSTIHHAHYVPAVYEVDTFYDINGTEVSYQLTMTNDFGRQSDLGGQDAFADETVALRAVTLGFDEVVRESPGRGVELYPESVVVEQMFDINDLSVTTSASLQFNNFKELFNIYGGDAPSLFMGEWATYQGLVAIIVEVLIDQFAPEAQGGALLESSGWTTLFTGYGNVTSTVVSNEGGNTKYVMQCQGRELCMKTAKFNIPWMDGWNEYFAAAYLANISGVKRGTLQDSDLYFRGQVPNTPYDESPGGGAYFLPMGNGGTPLMRFAAGSKPWQVLGKIGRQSGFVRYFDAFGKFHWEKFDPTAQRPDAVLFVDYRSPEPFDAMRTVFHGSLTRDLSGVRNKVAVIGINAEGPLWYPTVSMRTDFSSLYGNQNSIWDSGVSNFLGFENAFVWADSQFSNLPYSSRAADEIFRVMRMPAVTGQYTTWLQTALYPGKWVGIVDVKAGAYGRSSGTFLPFLVLGVVHRVMKGQPPTTDLACRYIPN